MSNEPKTYEKIASFGLSPVLHLYIIIRARSILPLRTIAVTLF